MRPGETKKVEHNDSSPAEMNGRAILVAYASGFGSTREVAQAVAGVLCAQGARVDVKWVNHVVDLEKYDAVIIGSAIRYDHWMREARQFMQSHHRRLSELPVACFFTCLTLSARNEKTERQAEGYAKKIANQDSRVKPICVAGFAGVLDYGKFPFFVRWLLRIPFSLLGVKEGDYRDWNSIRAWAKTVHVELKKHFSP